MSKEVIQKKIEQIKVLVEKLRGLLKEPRKKFLEDKEYISP